MKKVKKITILLAIAVMVATSVTIFYACTKEKGTTDNIVENFVNVTENPYDFFGKLHNEAMEEIVLSLKNPTFDLNSLAFERVQNAMLSMKTDFSKKEWEKMLRETLIEYKKIAENDFLKKSINMQDEYFACLELTEFQTENIQKIFDIVENSDNLNSIQDELTAIETKILQAPNGMDEKAIVLGFLSVAKHSNDFWGNHPELFASKGFLQAVKNCVKADAGGFVAGVVGGVVAGHAAAGLVFGPGGVVCTLAADGTIGAIVSSGGAAIAQVVPK